MEIYEKYGLELRTDFEVRRVYEDDLDLDLFIDLGNRSLDLYLDDQPDFLLDRLQFPKVSSILIRLSKDQDNSLSTIHFLRNIDLKSSYLNFIVDYGNLSLSLEKGENKNILKLVKKEVI